MQFYKKISSTILKHSFRKTLQCQQLQKRNLFVHEYQSIQILNKFGLNTPRGRVAETPEEAEEIAREIIENGGDVVVKAQILAGGRGKGYFTNGFKGGVHIVTSAEEAKEISSKMLGQTLITKQTGPQGKPVNKVLLQERLYARRELYLAILLDRATKSPVLVASKKGGMNIEDVAAESPEHIIKMPINVEKGLVDEDLEKVAQQMGFKNETGFAIQQIKRLYEMFQKTDALLVEINPLMETPDRRLICSDAKVNFDDNAEFRQPEIFKLRDLSQIDPREVHAQKYNLSYIGLDGNIGCIVNGAGLAMATMDIIKVHGGNPANFLDVGGGATQEQIQEALRILNQDPQVKAILVNIFGGIMRCDVMANAIINAMTKNEKFSVPLVVRLQGTNSVKAKEILKESGLRIIPADDLDEAARKAVGVANIVQVAESVDIDVEFRS